MPTCVAWAIRQHRVPRAVAVRYVPAQPMVKPYSTWNMSGSYECDKHLTLTAGVRNLFDQLPPWRVGRAYFLKANYKM
nr:TonB-dependent receptor [Chromobacterium violaceum]